VSEYWDIKCIPCDSVLPVHASRAAKGLAEACKAAVDIAAATGAGLVIDFNGSFDIYPERRIDQGWFQEHVGHRLTPWSEYERAPEDCFMTVTCPHCAYGRRSCTLGHGHEGECKA
jgi:hypothetical protein